MQRWPPLAQQLTTAFTTDAQFDNPRAVQVRWPRFTLELLTKIGWVGDLDLVGAVIVGQPWASSAGTRDRAPPR